MSEYKLAAKQHKLHQTHIEVGQHTIGEGSVNVIAGPCAVESEEQLFAIAKEVSALGINFLRGGAYKPRTSPYDFQGLGKQGLQLLKKAADTFNLKIVTEVLGSSLIEEVYPYADILQVGSRNMKNYQFLKELGRLDKPILLKRGMSSTIKEWLLAAEYILLSGNEKVILCERGIRTFDDSVRNTMDIAAIPLVKELSHLPVIADPSQGTGKRSLIQPVSAAAIAAGADGLMIEVHNQPEEALSDGEQSIDFNQLRTMMPALKQLAASVNKTFNTSEKIHETV
jgi:3-deoxy-7-phosphoheptulonate synthase